MADGTLALAVELIDIDAQRKELKEELKRRNAQRREVETELIDGFTRACVQNVSISGHTVYIHLQKWVRILDSKLAVGLVSGELGCPEALQVGTQRLSSMAREDEEFAATLEATGAFKVEEVFSIRSRRS